MNNDALAAEVKQYCSQLSEPMKKYLQTERGISLEIIKERKIGQKEDDTSTIPITNDREEYVGIKFRQYLKNSDGRSRYWSTKKTTVQLYARDVLKKNLDELIFAEGEHDCLALLSRGYCAVSGTGGASTVKKEWAKEVEHVKNIYICYDTDKAGRDGARKLAQIIPWAKIVTLPDMGEGKKDIIDYFVKCNKTKEDFEKLLLEAKPLSELEQKKKITLMIPSKEVFAPMYKEELLTILGQTIKRDDVNKLITFACELTAYTEDGQFNISFNAPASTGKSYLPIEIAAFFPPEDVSIIGYCSPTAFFHDSGLSVTVEDGLIVIHLDRKIIIFLDQPHDLLLQHLRPLLSHDRKNIPIKITDKTKASGLRTKNILLRGFPAVIFCTARLKIDEQEATRFILLSPELTQEKIRDAMHLKLNKEGNREAYQKTLSDNPLREKLKERIRAIRDEHIDHVIIPSMSKIERFFMEDGRILRPRYLRDISRVVSLTKAFALLNLWHRDRRDSTIVANNDDVEQALTLWKSISQSQELNLSPYVFSIYNDIIVPLCLSSEHTGYSTTRQEVMKKHFKLYERPLPDGQLRKEILVMLETAGLIVQERDQTDRRKTLIYLANEDERNSVEAETDALNKRLENI